MQVRPLNYPRVGDGHAKALNWMRNLCGTAYGGIGISLFKPKPCDSMRVLAASWLGYGCLGLLIRTTFQRLGAWVMFIAVTATAR